MPETTENTQLAVMPMMSLQDRTTQLKAYESIISLSFKVFPIKKKTSNDILDANKVEDVLFSKETVETPTDSEGKAQSHTKADKAVFGVYKQILFSEEIDEINRLDQMTRKLLGKMTLPGVIRGTFVVNGALTERVETFLNERAFLRNQLVNEFISSYPQRVKEALRKLKGYASENDYPKQEDLPKYFNMEWINLQIDVNSTLGEVNPELHRRQTQVFDDMNQSHKDSLIFKVKTEMIELFSTCRSNLEDYIKFEKNFRSNCTDNITEYLNLFEFRTAKLDLDFKVIQAAELVKKEMEKIYERLRVFNVSQATKTKKKTVIANYLKSRQAIMEKLIEVLTEAINLCGYGLNNDSSVICLDMEEVI